MREILSPSKNATSRWRTLKHRQFNVHVYLEICFAEFALIMQMLKIYLHSTHRKFNGEFKYTVDLIWYYKMKVSDQKLGYSSKHVSIKNNRSQRSTSLQE